MHKNMGTILTGTHVGLAKYYLLGDCVDTNDVPFLGSFPYVGTPHQGYEHVHHKS